MSDQPINGNPQAPQQIPPGPVPTIFALDQGTVMTPDGTQTVIVFQAQTPQGLTVLFIDPEEARNLGNAMVQMGTAATSGLIVPPAGLQLPPNVN
jgi:hypothetical protein